MSGIMCTCKKKINEGDKVFWVEKSKSDILVGTCSKECAEKFKDFVIDKLEKKLKSVKEQVIEEDVL